MKTDFCCQLSITDQDDKYTVLEFDNAELAQDRYKEKLEELRKTRMPFQMSMKLIYRILEDDGQLNTERFYMMAAHNECGAFWGGEVTSDTKLLKSHVKNGFFSANAKKVRVPDFRWRCTALALANGVVVGYIL